MEPTWREEPITDKQKQYIIKLCAALDWDTPIPSSKGNASDLIGKMIAEAEKRIAITGRVKYDPCFDMYGDEDDISDHTEDAFSIY